MDRRQKNEDGSDDKNTERSVSPLRAFFIWCWEVYTKLRRLIFDRVYFTEDEVRYMIDIVDIWIEGHRDIDPDDDELNDVYENFAIAVDVRDKLWRQLNER